MFPELLLRFLVYLMKQFIVGTKFCLLADLSQVLLRHKEWQHILFCILI